MGLYDKDNGPKKYQQAQGILEVYILLINFNQIEEQTVPGMHGGTGEMSIKMHTDMHGKIVPCKIHPGGSIGLHSHGTNDEMNYIISGHGKAICDNHEETLEPGVCHVCHSGSKHSIINTGDEDLVMVTIVTER